MSKSVVRSYQTYCYLSFSLLVSADQMSVSKSPLSLVGKLSPSSVEKVVSCWYSKFFFCTFFFYTFIFYTCSKKKVKRCKQQFIICEGVPACSTLDSAMTCFSEHGVWLLCLAATLSVSWVGKASRFDILLLRRSFVWFQIWRIIVKVS